jgi:hypothetical protein
VTVREWLRNRSPSPPPRLTARIEETLADRCDRSAGDAPASCVEAAGELLRELLSRSSAGRESALDLLTVDALVTYAFEAAAADPASLSARAQAAMQSFAAAGRA